MSHVKSAMFFLGLSFFVLGANAKAADYIVPCHIKDTADCYLSSARKALPYIAAMADPLVLGDVKADQGDLVFQLKELILKGLTNCKILKLERPEQLKALLVLECPVVVTGQYTFGGALLGLPVDGNGDVEIKTDNIQLNITIGLKSYKEKDNEDHYKVVKFDYEYNPITQVFYKFTNLYNGDTDKAKALLLILDDLETGKEILRTIAKPVVKEVAKNVISDHINTFFKNNPSKDIELP